MKLLSGAEISCLVSVLERVGIMEVFLKKIYENFSGHWKLSVIERSPYQRGVRIERFDFILFYH